MTTDKEQRALLENFVIANKDLEELEAKISRFNIFKAVGIVRQEIKPKKGDQAESSVFSGTDQTQIKESGLLLNQKRRDLETPVISSCFLHLKGKKDKLGKILFKTLRHGQET